MKNQWGDQGKRWKIYWSFANFHLPEKETESKGTDLLPILDACIFELRPHKVLSILARMT